MHRYVDDVLIGMGDCNVYENGEAVLPSKMALAALRVESQLRGLPTDLKRPELTSQVKVPLPDRHLAVHACVRCLWHVLS